MDEAALELTRAWLVKADHDVQAARILASSLDGPPDTAIYHCQQGAEKAVKAFLVWRNIEFEKTHDVRLVAQAIGVEPGFQQWKSAAEVLTPYATAFRYPAFGDDPLPSSDELKEAIDLAQGIFKYVVSLVPP